MLLRSLAAVLLSFLLTAICQVKGNIDEAERILNEAIQLAQAGRVEEAGKSPLTVTIYSRHPQPSFIHQSRNGAGSLPLCAIY